MALYLISYDLNKPEQDYPKLWEALKSLGAKKVLYSEWVTRRTGTSSEGLRDYVRQFIDSDDRLLVVDMSSGWASWNVMAKISDM